MRNFWTGVCEPSAQEHRVRPNEWAQLVLVHQTKSYP
jgi:hypothetical protein